MRLCFAEATKLFELRISHKKTEVLHHPGQRTPHTYTHTHIRIDQKSHYQECTISSDAQTDKEIYNRLAKAVSAFVRLYKRVCNNRRMKQSTKTRAQSPLLCGLKSWVLYLHHPPLCYQHPLQISLYSLNVSDSLAPTLFSTSTG